MLPKCLLSIKGRTSNPTPLVHQEMTKKNTFYGNNKDRCKMIDISIYVPSLISIPFCTFQDMARTSNHYEKINGYGEIAL